MNVSNFMVVADKVDFAGRRSGAGWRWMVVSVSLLALAACGDKKADAPSGQVVARLNGEDITQLEVTAELQGMNVPPNVERREAEKAALQNIITRRSLMQSAMETDLFNNPQFRMQQRRTDEQLHVQALARSIASKVAKPAGDEIDRFMEENPYLFRERRFFLLDQIQFLPPQDISKLGMEQLKTMGDVERALQANGVEFRRQPASLDALGANPQFVREVSGLLERNPDELFMFANRGPGGQPVMLVNRVTETRVQPFTGDRAREFAERFLMNERIQKALAAEVEKQRESLKDKVTYQEGWKPTEPKPADPKAVAGAQPSGPGIASGNAAPTPFSQAPDVAASAEEAAERAAAATTAPAAPAAAAEAP